jgi:Cu/Ag efflux pump CusA
MVSDFNFKRYPVNLRFPREVRDDLENMQRIAASMVGGMITAPLLSLFVVPAKYLLWKRRKF